MGCSAFGVMTNDTNDRMCSLRCWAARGQFVDLYGAAGHQTLQEAAQWLIVAA